MKIKFLSKFIWAISLVFSLHVSASTFTSVKYLYSKDQLVAEIYISKNDGEEEITKLKKFVNSVFKQSSLLDSPKQKYQFKIIENQFYIGRDDEIKLKINFADFPQDAQLNFVKTYCEDTDCDLAIKSSNLSFFSNQSRDIKISNDDLHVIKNEVVFTIKKEAPQTLKQAIVKNHDGDLIYTGKEGQIISYKKRSFESNQQNFIINLFKQNQSIPLYTGKMDKNLLDTILKLTNVDCVTNTKFQYSTSCVKHNFKFADNEIEKNEIKIFFKDGDVIFKKERDFESDFLEKMQEILSPIAITNDFNALISSVSMTSPFVHSPHLINNITIKYLKDEKVVIFNMINHVSPETRASIHDFIISQFDIDKYQIFSNSLNGEILISEHSVESNARYSKLSQSTVYKKYLELGVNFKSNNNEIDAPYAIRYLSRSKLPSFAIASTFIEYWPFRFPVGFSSNLNIYNITHESVDLSGNVTKHSGMNIDYDLMTKFKYLLNKSKKLTELEFGLGLENRIYNVDTNDSIGSLSTQSIIARFDYKTHFKKFKVSGGFKIAYLMNFDQTFSNTTNFSSTSGIGFGLRGQIQKKIDRHTYAHIGVEMSNMNLILGDYTVGVSDLSGQLGISYRWGEE